MDSRNSENRGTGQMARPKATRQDKVAGLAERAGKPDRLRREIDNGAVKEARAYVKGWSPQVQTRTQAQYEKLTDRLQATGKTPEQAAGTKAAYYAYRAAAVHEARSELKEALTARDKAARTQDAAGRETAEDRIRNAVAVLEHYKPGERDKVRDKQRKWDYTGPEKSERSNGKREAVGKRDAGWRDRVWEQVREKDKDAVAVLALSGARPAELNKGVAVTRTKDGLRFDISGAKVDDRTGRGQEKRSVSVTKEAAEKSPEGRHLLTELRRTGDTRTVTPDGSTDALSRRLGRAGERAGEQHVSAYDYRHAFADRAKADGADKGELARALGHRAEESQAAYGGAGGGGSGGGFSRATASRSVR
ncbi:site-specific integrase [Acidithiobacillus ferridurans]|uniref:hypothetical protein n=1 Tax=Acidithiobacillus ferridurans TaxID=1232575 RepID=UPI001C07546C|nr:hypothetical protein [Acidithiobacillus ferridurans]